MGGRGWLATRLAADRSAEGGARLTRAAAVTTSSLPALKAYLGGEQAYRAGQYAAAVGEFVPYDIPLVNDPLHPDWSPDGRTIVFEWDLPDDAGAVTAFVDADGGNLRTLEPSVCIDGQPSFSPDGERIVYESYNCDVDDALYSRAVDGSDAQRITPVGPNGYTDPNVSRDGTRLAYVEFENGVEFQQALVVSDVDGGNAHRLTPYSFDVGIKVAWSPDGRQLAFTKDANEIDGGPLEANVAVVNADGTGLHVLTDYHGGRFSAFLGSYSPDGRWILYRLQDNENEHYALWRMWPDGTHRKQIVDLGGLLGRASDWGAPS